MEPRGTLLTTIHCTRTLRRQPHARARARTASSRRALRAALAVSPPPPPVRSAVGVPSLPTGGVHVQVAAARGGTPAPRTLLPAHCPAPGRPAGSLPPRMHACAADHWLCGSPARRRAGPPARRGAALLAAWRVMRDHEVKSGASRARGAGGASTGVQWFATTRARRRATTRRSLSLWLWPSPCVCPWRPVCGPLAAFIGWRCPCVCPWRVSVASVATGDICVSPLSA